VFTRLGGGTLWENHQVLVYGVTESGEGEGRVVDFKTYDPNYPRDDGLVIRVRGFAGTASDKHANPDATRADQRPQVVTISRLPSKQKPTVVRGFFVMPFAPRTPPDDLK
jgi:hypothetical protein